MLRRQLTVETKDKPHVKMWGMTRHISEGSFEDRDDFHYLPVVGYDDMSTIDINRKQLGWAVVGYGHLDELVDPNTGRMRSDAVQLKNELDHLIQSPESKYGLNYEAGVRAEIEAKVRAEFEAELVAKAASNPVSEKADKAEKLKKTDEDKKSEA